MGSLETLPLLHTRQPLRTILGSNSLAKRPSGAIVSLNQAEEVLDYVN